MNAFLSIDMQKATQLTREGRLKEAMAVLQGATPIARENAARQASPASHEKLIDLSAPAQPGGAWSMPGASPTPRAKRAPMFGAGLRTQGAMQPPITPAGARFETRTHTGPGGSRAYKIYVPSGYKGQPLPLVVMLHGCTQSPDDFARGTRMNEHAEAQLFLVAYPAQDKAANPSRCWNWFNGAEQRREGGEPSLIAGVTREVMSEFSVADGRVFIAGLSAGGAAAAIMGATHPDLYAAIGVHSGLACGAARDLPSALSAMRQGAPGAVSKGVPTIVFHGDRDGTVHPANGDHVIAQRRAGAGETTRVERGEAAGMAYTRTVHADRDGRAVMEQWLLHGAGHAWSGGDAAGTYADPRGPDASAEMMRFFLAQKRLLSRDDA